MTPEERVALIWERWVNQETIIRSHIEAAIRDAVNDALEQAAREAENTPHSRWARIAPHIRSLKHVSN